MFPVPLKLDPFDAALAPHLRRAGRLIAARLDDAKAHALGGAIATATQRLVDLHHDVAGPDGRGIVGEARAAFYWDSYRLDPFDPEIHDPDRRFPTSEEATAARTAPIGGVDAHRDLAVHIERARRGLVTATGNPAAIATWHQQQMMAMKAWARRTLSDSQVGLMSAIGAHRMRPEFRDTP